MNVSTNYIIGEPEFILARMTYCLLWLGSRGHYIHRRPAYGHVDEKLMDNFYTLSSLKIHKQLLAFGRRAYLIVSCVSLEMGNTVNPYFHTYCVHKSNLVSIKPTITRKIIWISMIKMFWFSVSWDQCLCCEVDNMCKTPGTLYFVSMCLALARYPHTGCDASLDQTSSHYRLIYASRTYATLCYYL